MKGFREMGGGAVVVMEDRWWGWKIGGGDGKLVINGWFLH